MALVQAEEIGIVQLELPDPGAQSPQLLTLLLSYHPFCCCRYFYCHHRHCSFWTPVPAAPLCPQLCLVSSQAAAHLPPKQLTLQPLHHHCHQSTVFAATVPISCHYTGRKLEEATQVKPLIGPNIAASEDAAWRFLSSGLPVIRTACFCIHRQRERVLALGTAYLSWQGVLCPLHHHQSALYLPVSENNPHARPPGEHISGLGGNGWVSNRG